MCKVEGCQKEVFSNGFCHSHYDANRLANAPECKVEGCDDSSHAKGLCSKHYRRELRNDENRPLCSIEGCKQTIHANGLCSTHHTRLRRHGSFNKTRPKSFKGTDKEYLELYRRRTSTTLMKKYGITLQEYEVMHEKQGGKCLICGEKEKRNNSFTDESIRMPVDHCHETGKVRGLLCTECNTGLGLFKDSKDILLKAIEYLDKDKESWIKVVINDDKSYKWISPKDCVFGTIKDT